MIKISRRALVISIIEEHGALSLKFDDGVLDEQQPGVWKRGAFYTATPIAESSLRNSELSEDDASDLANTILARLSAFFACQELYEVGSDDQPPPQLRRLF